MMHWIFGILAAISGLLALICYGASRPTPGGANTGGLMILPAAFFGLVAVVLALLAVLP